MILSEVLAPKRRTISSLRSWKHSFVVIDSNGDAWNSWNDQSHRILPNKHVLKFAPTLDDGSSAKYNPLCEVRLGTLNEVRDVMHIVKVLVDLGQMDHLAKTGHALLVGTIIHLMYVFRKEGRGVPSLADVASFLSRPDATFEASLSEMKNYHHISEDEFFENNVFERIYDEYVKDLSVLKDTLRDFPVPDFHDKKYSLLLTHPMVAEVAAVLQSKSLVGIVSAALHFLEPYQDPVVAMNTRKSDFSVEDLLRDDVTVCLYLVVPAADTIRMRSLIQMILHLAFYRLPERLGIKDCWMVEIRQHLLILLNGFLNIENIDSLRAFLPAINVQLCE